MPKSKGTVHSLFNFSSFLLSDQLYLKNEFTEFKGVSVQKSKI